MSELAPRARDFAPVGVGRRDADVRRRGDRRHRDEHADERARLRRREREHSGDAREQRHDHGEPVRVGDEERLGMLRFLRRLADPAEDQCAGVRREDRHGKSHGERDPAAPREVEPPLDERHAERRERPELRADDHRPDDQDDRVGDDPDACDQGRDDHEREKAPGELRPLRRPRLDLLPDDGVGRRTRSDALRTPRDRRHGRVDVLQDDRPTSSRPRLQRSSTTMLASSRATSHVMRSPSGRSATPGRWTIPYTDSVSRSTPRTGSTRSGGTTRRMWITVRPASTAW